MPHATPSVWTSPPPGRPRALLLPEPRLPPSTMSATPANSRSAPAPANRTTSECSTVRPARNASSNARVRPCSTAFCPRMRPSPSSSTSARAAASPHRTPGRCPPRHRRPPGPQGRTTHRRRSRRARGFFPLGSVRSSATRNWSFVSKKQKNCNPLDPAADHRSQGGTGGTTWPLIRSIDWSWTWCRGARDGECGGGGPAGQGPHRSSPGVDDQRCVAGLRGRNGQVYGTLQR